MLPALALALLVGSSAVDVSSARIEVLEGRAALAGPQGVRELWPEDRATYVSGEAYLEVPALSRASIRWRSSASLLVIGPAALEWGPDVGREVLEWRLVSQTETHLEIRRGPIRVRLPGGWTATFESGAACLRSSPGGGLELHHDAGLPVLLVAPHEPARARPPRVVLAGARLRLDPQRSEPRLLPGSRAQVLAPYARPEGLATAAGPSVGPWEGFSWPWNVRAFAARIAPAPAISILPAPSAQSEGARAERELVSGRLPAPLLRWLLASSAHLARWRTSVERQPPAVERVAPNVRRHGRLRLTPYGARWENPRR